MSLYWLTQAVAYWSLVLFLVPLKYIKQLMLFAFLNANCGLYCFLYFGQLL